jgi:hypothetical protein
LKIRLGSYTEFAGVRLSVCASVANRQVALPGRRCRREESVVPLGLAGGGKTNSVEELQVETLREGITLTLGYATSLLPPIK